MTTAIRFFSALLLVAVTFSGLHAQLAVGLKGGLNYNKVYTTENLGAIAPNFTTLQEVHTGLLLDIPVAGGFSLQPELNLITKGFGLRQGLDVPVFGIELPLNARAESRFRYVEMPLLAKYTVGQDVVQAYFVAGPTFGYATKGQIDTRANVLVEVDLGTLPLNLDNIDYERFEIGAAIGAGLQLNFGGLRAFADARYQRGFTELYNIPLVEEKVRNTGVAFSAGLMLPLRY